MRYVPPFNRRRDGDTNADRQCLAGMAESCSRLRMLPLFRPFRVFNGSTLLRVPSSNFVLFVSFVVILSNFD